MQRALICCLPFLLLFEACSENRRSVAEKRMEGQDLAALRMDAARFYKQIYTIEGPDFMILKATKWPESFRRLGPVRVGVYRDGFALALGGEVDTEWGLHIYPTGMAQTREVRAGYFERVADGVYWYSLAR